MASRGVRPPHAALLAFFILLTVAATRSSAAGREAVDAGATPALTPATLTGPAVTPTLKSGEDAFVELSWTAPAQPVPASFFVQVLALDTAGAYPAFSSYLKQSAILVRLPSTPGTYSWRVYTVAISVPDDAPSAWSYFSLR